MASEPVEQNKWNLCFLNELFSCFCAWGSLLDITK